MMVIPAILTDSLSTLHNQLHRLTPYFRNMQIDLVDGIYLPQRTLSVEEVIDAVMHDPATAKKSSVSFDFDLMVSDYKHVISVLEASTKDVSISHVFVHYGSIAGAPLPTSKSFSIGIAIAPQDEIHELELKYDLKIIPCIQIMSVIPGSQGGLFIPESLIKIEQLRKAGYRSEIFLDGGVNNNTLQVIRNNNYKPDGICVGSFLSHAKDVRARAAELDIFECS